MNNEFWLYIEFEGCNLSYQEYREIYINTTYNLGFMSSNEDVFDYFVRNVPVNVNLVNRYLNKIVFLKEFLKMVPGYNPLDSIYAADISYDIIKNYEEVNMGITYKITDKTDIKTARYIKELKSKKT